MYSSTDAAVDAVRSNQVVAFLTDAATLQYFAQVHSQPNCSTLACAPTCLGDMLCWVASVCIA